MLSFNIQNLHKLAILVLLEVTESTHACKCRFVSSLLHYWGKKCFHKFFWGEHWALNMQVSSCLWTHPILSDYLLRARTIHITSIFVLKFSIILKVVLLYKTHFKFNSRHQNTCIYYICHPLPSFVDDELSLIFSSSFNSSSSSSKAFDTLHSEKI